MVVNSIIGSLLVYTLLDLSIDAGMVHTACTASGEFFITPASRRLIGLVNGSDYPLPGVFPLFSVDAFLERKWRRPEVGDHLKLVRGANPLLFDFLLKRHLRIDGIKFGRDVFETARIFRRIT